MAAANAATATAATTAMGDTRESWFINFRLAAADISEPLDAAENPEAKDAAEPIESADAADPTEPNDSTEPTQPIDSADPSHPMHRIESSDHNDHFEFAMVSQATVRDMADAVDGATARKMWRTLEPIHGMIYFAPEAAASYAQAGLDDARAGYFASRAAPMGAVPAEVVVATFFNFNPVLVGRAVPRCWELVPPGRMLAARLDAVDAALHRILGADVESPSLAEASELAQVAASAPSMTPVGRPLYGGHASLPWPDAPHLALWHAISVLREYRGDGHIAALVCEGLDAVEALVVHAATGEVPRAALQGSRAWDDASWEAGESRVRERGWIDGGGLLTDAGRAGRDRVEQLTDELALAPWRHLGTDGCARLRELARPFSKAVVAAGTFSIPSAQ